MASSIHDSLYGTGTRVVDWTVKMIQEKLEPRQKEYESLASAWNVSAPLFNAFTQNMEKNRDRSVILFDHTRVILEDNWKGDTNYIHASFVHEGDFILTQNPMPNTLVDFWRCIWQQNVSVIVCQASMENTEECCEYWPKRQGKKMNVGGKAKKKSLFGKHRFVIQNIAAPPNIPDVSEVTELEVTGTTKEEGSPEKRRICHIRCLNWTTTDYPPEDSVLKVAENIWNVHKSMVSLAKDTKHPILIHSSTGTRRSGLLAAVSVCYRELVEGLCVNIRRAVTKIKYDRFGCFTSHAEYAYVYSAIVQAAINRRKIDARNKPAVRKLQKKLRDQKIGDDH